MRSELIVLQNSSQQTRSSATVKTPFVQCRAIRHSGTSHLLSSTAPLRLYKQANKRTNKQTLLLYWRRQPIVKTRHSPQWLSTNCTVAVQELCQISVSHSGDEDPLFGDVTLSFRVSVPRRFEGAKRLHMQEFRGPKIHHLKTEAPNAFETSPNTLSHLAIPAISRSLLTSAHQPQELTSVESLSHHSVLRTKSPSAL